MTDALTQMLATKRTVLADGATGTHLRKLAVTDNISIPAAQEVLNLENPDFVRRHHRAYIEAGSDLLLTNTWAANRFALEDAGRNCSSVEIRQINKAGAELLRQEVAASGRAIVCAGSVGPTGWIVCAQDDHAPKSIDRRELDYSAAVEGFTDQIIGLLDGGADIIWVESQFGAHEVHAAIDACEAAGKALNLPSPFVLSMTFSKLGRTELEYDIEDFAKEFGRGSRRPVAIGFNCGFGPEVALSLVGDHRESLNGLPPLLVKANLGRPIWSHDKFEPIGLTENQMKLYAQLAVDFGVRIVGACCGSLPQHISAMRNALIKYEPKAPPQTSELHALLDAAI